MDGRVGRVGYVCVTYAALNPRLFLCVPPAILLVILCKTYFIRFPLASIEADATPGEALRTAMNDTRMLDEGEPQPAYEPAPAHEGEVRYYMNLRDIQNMYVDRLTPGCG